VRRRVAVVVVACIVLVSQAALARAQYIRGVVHDAADGRPIAGAVVVVIDSGGAAVTRGITNAEGLFAVTRPSRPSMLHILRIGYRPRDLVISSADRDLTDVSLAQLPSVLEAVRVTDKPTCPGGEGSSAAFALWEQARAGLLAAVVTSEANPSYARALTFDRQLSEPDSIVQAQHLEPVEGYTARPFRASAPAAFLAEHGFMAEDSTGRTFYGPDAEVLVDTSFAASHCFRLHPTDSSRRDQVGLEFTPAPGRDTLVDVSGVIWIGSVSPALRSLQFRYTGLEPAAMRSGAGGEVVFREVANGAVFVERWTLRLPTLTRRQIGASPPQPVAPGRDRSSRTDLRVLAMKEVGGRVTDARWVDGVTWHELPSGISGIVAREGSDAPIAGAQISLGAIFEATESDAHGQFVLAPVIPGRYALTVIDTSFRATSAARRMTRTVDVLADRITDVQLRVVMPRVTALRNSPNTREIHGVVRDSLGEPASGFTVLAQEGQLAKTDDSGRFRIRLPSREAATLDVRRIGFIPARLNLAPGGDTGVVLFAVPIAQRLGAVTVSAASTLASIHQREFEQRLLQRRRGTNSGYFITASDIEQRSAAFATHLFYDIPGVRVLRVGKRGNLAVFGVGRTFRGGGTCPAAVYIDGVRIPDGGDDDTPVGVAIDQHVLPWDIAGIEVYPRAIDAPAQFQPLNGSCAVVLIWTK
jgi:carboxypeptidase family protein